MDSLMLSSEVNVLRELGDKYAEIAALDIRQEKVNMWKNLNSLKRTRPMVMLDQLPWNELSIGDELALKCNNPFLKSIELNIRRKLYKWKHFKADMVIDNWIDIPKTIRNTGIGPTIKQDISVSDPTSSVVGHKYYDVIPDEDALNNLKTPIIRVDEELDKKRYDIACEIFEGILPVRMSGIVIHSGLWDKITSARGVETILYDIVDRPEFVLKIINKYVNMAMEMLDQYEELGLLDPYASLIHCTGAYTDELPSKEYNGIKAKGEDVWTYGLAQVLGTVSPQMYDELEIAPIKPLLERFGLVYYGCCDPLDRKIDIVRKINNVRKISISPWADKERSAETMAGDFVFSNKPNPAFLAADVFDPEIIRKDIEETVEICKRYNTPCEIILKDVSTVKYKPQRLTEWEKIVMDVVLSAD